MRITRYKIIIVLWLIISYNLSFNQFYNQPNTIEVSGNTGIITEQKVINPDGSWSWQVYENGNLVSSLGYY
jgi:hypothetical protein